MNDLAESRSVDPEVAAALKLDGKPRKKRRRWLVYGAIALGVIVVGLVLLPKKPQQGYELGKVERGTLEVKVTATGTLAPLSEVDVGAEVSGRIDSVNVDYNDKVDQGRGAGADQHGPAEGQAGAIAGRARPGRCAASRRQGGPRRHADHLKRTRALEKSGAASVASLDTSRIAADRADANVKSAEAQVQLSQAALDADQSALDKATIKAPTNGIVLDRLIEPGQTVAATFQTPVLFKIAEDLTRMELDVDIDEADIGSVEARAEGDLHGRCLSRTALQCARSFRSITRPRPSRASSPTKAVLSVDNPDLALKPGMTATAEILVASLKNAITVPSGALRFVPEGEDATPPKPLADGSGNFAARLWTPASPKPKPIEVIAGASDGERTVIVKGDVHAGESVIIDTTRRKKPSGGFGPGG